MPDRPEASNLWSRLDMARFADLLGSPLQPVVVLQTSDSGDGLVRQWPPPEDRVAMHRGYAFQWFGMAIALLVFYLVANLRRRRANVVTHRVTNCSISRSCPCPDRMRHWPRNWRAAG